MRPSGRKANRHGSLNVVTVVSVKGRLASGVCSPTFTWGQAATEASVRSNAAFTVFIVISPLLFKRPTLRDPGRIVIVHCHDDRAKQVKDLRCGERFPKT